MPHISQFQIDLKVQNTALTSDAIKPYVIRQKLTHGVLIEKAKKHLHATDITAFRATISLRCFTDPAAITPAVQKIFDAKWKKGQAPEMWDGKTAERIVAILEKL